jgi:hypothetical protein
MFAKKQTSDKSKGKIRMNNNNNTRKQMIDDEMGYFFGFSRGSYGEVLGDLSRTKVNSCLTSSIPLAEFWQPANLDKISKMFSEHLPDFNPVCALKFFEFPTDALFDGERVGRPSMTDIMVLEAGVKIAIEGKMTEYVRFADKTIREWLVEMSGSTDIMLRRRVLRAWIHYIHNAGCSGLADYAEFLKSCMDVSYQFLHRTASACNKAGAGTDSTPVLVYQLFFDAKDVAHIAKLQAFKADLRRWAATLKLQNMKFLIASVPVVNMADVEKRFAGWHGEIFDAMRHQTIYRFDFDGITVETVVNDKAAGNA